MRRLLDLTSSPAVPGAVTCTSAAQTSTSLLVPTEVRQAGWGWVFSTPRDGEALVKEFL